MYRFMLTSLLALAVIVTGVAQAADDKPESIGDFMSKAHKGAKAFKQAIAKDLKAKDFDSAATTMKTWSAMAKHLSEFEPPKGEKEAWKKITKKYTDTLKALSKAVDDKDGAAAAKNLKAINSSCGTCHKAHKGS
jgi:hypothetical protein